MASSITLFNVLFALAIGVVPSLLWLYFWLRRDRRHPEPWWLLTLCFFGGIIIVPLAGFLQKVTFAWTSDATMRTVIWAGIEELLKFGVFYFVVYHSKYNDEPVDASIYLITVALGFAALENVLYTLDPGMPFTITGGILTGGLRFFGSTLLHVVASAFIGITISIVSKKMRAPALLLGLIGAITIHTVFNLFIMKSTVMNFLPMYAYLWLLAISAFVLLEKLSQQSQQVVLNTSSKVSDTSTS